jgi:hypothetical protein
LLHAKKIVPLPMLFVSKHHQTMRLVRRHSTDGFTTVTPKSVLKYFIAVAPKEVLQPKQNARLVSVVKNFPS